MAYKRLWVVVLCLGLLLMPRSTAMAQDMSNRDLNGISPQNHKYIITTLGSAAVGAGLGFLLGGGAKTGKLALIGGGAGSAWFLHSHRYALGKYHDWAMVGSGTALGAGIGWTICDCDNGLIAGTLIGGGSVATWEALKDDRAAHNAFNSNKDKKIRGSARNAQQSRDKTEHQHPEQQPQ